jgi:hypothetical protein
VVLMKFQFLWDLLANSNLHTEFKRYQLESHISFDSLAILFR